MITDQARQSMMVGGKRTGIPMYMLDEKEAAAAATQAMAGPMLMVELTGAGPAGGALWVQTLQKQRTVMLERETRLQVCGFSNHRSCKIVLGLQAGACEVCCAHSKGLNRGEGPRLSHSVVQRARSDEWQKRACAASVLRYFSEPTQHAYQTDRHSVFC